MQRLRRTVDDDYGETGFLSIETAVSPSRSRSTSVSSRPSATSGSSRNGGANCILHQVSRLDTLAGVAIRYGVEVADIKRLNGLSCDLQMFALKTLQIPSPGKHPPSPASATVTALLVGCKGSYTEKITCRQSSAEQSPFKHKDIDLFDSFHSLKLSPSLERKVSPAMSSLQGYYGTKQTDKKAATPDELEMAAYHDGAANQLQNEPTASSSPLSYPLPSHYRKSRSVANSLMSANGNLHDCLLSQDDESSSSTAKWIDKLLRRRQKSASDFTSYPPEKVMKEESCSGSSISSITGKGLALRPKSSTRIVSNSDSEPVISPSIPIALVEDTSSSFRKSLSTSSLETDSGAFSSLWPTSKWIPKPDFQALSSAAIPILDGLPRAIGMKSKTALD